MTYGDRLSAASKVLRHPLTLLLLGGMLTAVVGPLITRSWQNHERALEVKSDLVDRMSQSTAALMTSVQIHEFNPNTLKRAEYLDAFRQWDERSQVIDARLFTYFHRNKKLIRGWRKLSFALFAYHNLGSISGRRIQRQITRCPKGDPAYMSGRPRNLCAIGNYLGTPWNRYENWRTVNLLVPNKDGVKYQIGWRILKYALIDRRDQLIREVIASDASV